MFIAAIGNQVLACLKEHYSLEIGMGDLSFNETRKEFEGDITLVLFPLLRSTKSNPNQLGEQIGSYVVQQLDFLESFNLIKGFLNFKIKDSAWLSLFHKLQDDGLAPISSTDRKYLVEFSSPNTNKPLHLGHVRNILLGWSVSKILERAGNEVVKTQIINDRGIAICKSMLAWERFADGATPESTGIKSDHFVGKYYVVFEQKFKEEYETWQVSEDGKSTYNALKKEDQSEEAFFKAYKNKYFNTSSTLGKAAKEMLLKWEDNDTEVRALWSKMNHWVYDGFEKTYDQMGVSFDSYYYESETYMLGKDIIEEALEQKVFYKKEDNSVWIDLEDMGLDHKLVLRSDGTSVYMTQDIGTAEKRYEDTKADGMVYVVADEQNYHFQALFAIMKKLEAPYADALHHLSYGMVDLPSGRMKSREGKVVDADDLIVEVIQEARNNAVERGENEGVSENEKNEIYEKVGKGALKFFILKVNPKKRMVFNPEESVDMQGATGPYIQNAYVRVQSILRKAGSMDKSLIQSYNTPEKIEVELIKKMNQFNDHILQAAKDFDPSVIAGYCYDLAKLYHKFYNDVRILGAASESAKVFRVSLGEEVAKILEEGFDLLGIEMPERM